jgi:hypothetical protein
VNESWVLTAGDLAWPIVVLMISVVVLMTQRGPIGRLIDRVKSLRYPGGAAELTEGSVDVISTLVDTLSRDLSERTDRAEDDGDPADLIANREPIGDFEPLPTEEVSGLVMLRTKVANLLSELAFPPPPGGFGRVLATIDVLVNRGVLDVTTAQALRDTMEIADEAARGSMVPRRVALAVENSGPAILDQLALLRTVAAARFEDHVLDTLRARLTPGWSVDTDRAIPRDWPAVSASDGAADGRPPAHARVDALVTIGERAVVVEVRARLQPGARGQIDAVVAWLSALPQPLPVLLVMLGDGLTTRELRRIRDAHGGAVELLLWDRDSGELIVAVRELAAQSGAPAVQGVTAT